ncbi:MAG: hypothetical protein H6907_15785 [Hyphomicrobiales bacterium]|nr:hypothetical protein [Hyphomicrobiales bacterium]MCP5373188.1 hypothetical protein [Hyphomicrobiales bacterium]
MSDQHVFAVLEAPRRTWAVASVHGEADSLRILHEELYGHLQPHDNLVYLGNLLGRSGAVADTIHELLMFRRAFLARDGADVGDVVYLRGSQEEMWQKMLQIQFAPNPREVLAWMEENGVGSTLAVYGATMRDAFQAADGGHLRLSQWTAGLRDRIRAVDGHNALMSSLRRAAYTRDNTLLFVNTGIDVSRPLSEQTDSFWWGGRDFEFIDAPYAGFRRLVRGYDHRHRGVVIKETTVTLDGGCGFGGPLVAGCFGPRGEMLEMIEV